MFEGLKMYYKGVNLIEIMQRKEQIINRKNIYGSDYRNLSLWRIEDTLFSEVGIWKW